MTKNINQTIKKSADKPVDLDNLLTILSHLEEYGLIERDIISVEDQHRIVWKRECQRNIQALKEGEY